MVSSSIGVQPGDRVTLYGQNCREWLVAYYAIAKTGAVVNPISSMLTTEEVRYVVADSGARAVVASIDKGIPLLDLDGTDGLSDVVLWGDDVPGWCRHVLCAVDRRIGLCRVRADPTAAFRSGGDLLHVGDDGPPEGRDAEPPGGHLGRGRDGADGARGPDDRVLNSLPLAHVYGSCVFNAAMMAGSTLVMVPRFDADGGDGRHRRASGDVDGRRSHGVLLPARPSGLRPRRPVEPDALLGRWPDPSRGQGDRVHRTDRLPDPRGVGNDRTGRGSDRQPRRRAEQAGHDRHRLPRQLDARRRHRRPQPSCSDRASAAS